MSRAAEAPPAAAGRAPGLGARFEHSPARFEVEGQVRRFLAAEAAGRTAWDLGSGLPVAGTGEVGPRRTLDRDPGTRPDVVADLERLPFADGTLPAAVSIAVLEHLERPRAAIAEMARVLAPGAPLLVWVPFLHELHLYPVDLWRFTPVGIRGLLEQGGFRTLSCEAAGGGGGAGVAGVLAHLYRFLLPPRRPLRGLRTAGFGAVLALGWLDGAAPAEAIPVGTTWIGTRGEGGRGAGRA